MKMNEWPDSRPLIPATNGVAGRKVILTEMLKILNTVIILSVFLEFYSYPLHGKIRKIFSRIPLDCGS